MLRRLIYCNCLLVLLASCFLPVATSSAHRILQTAPSDTVADFPTVDPDYIYEQLFYIATHFLHREAGYDSNLPPLVNGHDEFAHYWSQEMQRDLQGFGPQVVNDSFTIRGWKNRPAQLPALNVEVSVPGLTHPEQVVVIGCHYDGEAISTQSANDDASGCAIELGVAQAMATYWRTHHVYPARTLRFVIFDAEEQGLFGSFHYVNSTINGDLHNLVAMFNEEQSGIAYPLRYLGQLSNALMPFYTDMTPLKKSDLYPDLTLTPEQQQRVTHFHDLMQQAVPAVFQQFQTMGYDKLTYHDKNGQDIPQSIFTPADQKNTIVLEDDQIGSSDQVPFTIGGLPAATFVGNVTFYTSPSPVGSYPYDQSGDTIQLMNTFADGSSHKSYALTLSLALPGMLTTWMLNQSDILGQVASDHLPIAAISDIGTPQIGQPLTLDAQASFDPNTCKNSICSASNLSYTWDFGDGSKASGISVSHAYATAGTYTLTLTTHSPSGSRIVSKTLSITDYPLTIQNPYQDFIATGSPRTPPDVKLPTPNDSLSDKVPDRIPARPLVTPTATQPIASKPTAQSGFPPGIFVIIGVAAAILIFLIFSRLQSARTQK